MNPTMIVEALSAAGVDVERDRGASDDLAENLQETIKAAARFVGAPTWTPAAIHLVIDLAQSTYIFKEIVLLHGDLFMFCKCPPKGPDFTFVSAKNPASLQTERTKDSINHKHTLKVTLGFADGREPIILNADNFRGVERLEALVKNHLFPLFAS